MMAESNTITDRQQKILRAIVDEYIEKAEAVSSQLLEEEYDFGIRGAMIRREMHELTDRGYLTQPHISAGRIPTEKGYRFTVNAIMKDFSQEEAEDVFVFNENGEDIVRLMYRLTQEVAQESSAFCLGYLMSTQILWKEGWEEILRQPEFENTEYISKFVDFLEMLQDNLELIKISAPLSIFIGREHPFTKTYEFSTLIARCPLSRRETGLLALVGPMRMPYEQNIRILESLPSLIQKLSS